jgi:hypothetical protein
MTPPDRVDPRTDGSSYLSEIPPVPPDQSVSTPGTAEALINPLPLPLPQPAVSYHDTRERRNSSHNGLSSLFVGAQTQDPTHLASMPSVLPPLPKTNASWFRMGYFAIENDAQDPMNRVQIRCLHCKEGSPNMFLQRCKDRKIGGSENLVRHIQEYHGELRWDEPHEPQGDSVSLNTSETIAEDRTMPAALLAEIQRHQNLTPGATKGSSFSKSIPVVESERPKPEDMEHDANLYIIKESQDATAYDSSGLSQVKGADEDDSEEEQHTVLSSALFIPHHDKNYSSQEQKSVPLLSPVHVKPISPYSEKGAYFPEPDLPSSQELRPRSEEGFTRAEENRSLVDDHGITPPDSLKTVGHEFASSTTDHTHDDEADDIQPLEAIELMPYRHQVGGHTIMWRFAKRAVCKKLNNAENKFYEKVEESHPELLEFLPRCVIFITFRQRSFRLKLSLYISPHHSYNVVFNVLLLLTGFCL